MTQGNPSATRRLNLYRISSISFVSTLLVAILTLTSSSARGEEEAEKELEIHYTFKPENCDRKAKVTDLVTLHYKGTLENGQVFDSR